MFKFRLLLTVLILSNSANPLVFAASSAYTIEPTRLEITLSNKKPGITSLIKMRSTTDRPIKIKVRPTLWSLTETGAITYDVIPSFFNIMQFITVNPEEFELPDGKQQFIRFSVNLPESAPDGEYPFQLLFDQQADTLPVTQPFSNLSGIKLDVIPVLTTTIYVNKGHVAPDVKIDRFVCTVSPVGLSIELNIKNWGNQHARLTARLLSGLTDLNQENLLRTDKIKQVQSIAGGNLIFVMPQQNRKIQEVISVKNFPLLDKIGPKQFIIQLLDERALQTVIEAPCSVSG